MVYADEQTVITALASAFQAAGASPFWSDQGLASAGLVSAATLEANSDALLVWTSKPFKDPTGVGNTVATYLESGRQVVLAGDVYLAPNTGGIGGKMRASYILFTPGTLGVPVAGAFTLSPLVASPIFAGLGPIAADTPPSISTSPVGGAIVVGEWSKGAAAGVPVVVTGSVMVLGQPRNRVDLNMQVSPKSATFAGGWTGDGITLLLNALRYK